MAPSSSDGSPGSDFLLPRKRQRGSLNLVDTNANKSLRTTPSPAVTGNTTPESFEIDPEWHGLFGGDPNKQRQDMLDEQREAERIIEQERQDREFALSLERQDQSLFTPADPSMAGPSNADQRHSQTQTFLDGQGRYHRSEPSASSFTTDLLASSPFVLQDDPFANTSVPFETDNNLQFGSDSGRVKNESASLPQAFIDLESDEFDYSPPSRSSDLIEIDQNTWGQGQNSYVGGRDTSDGNASAGMVNPGNWNYTPQAFANAARGIYNSAYNLVDQQISSYNTAPSGFGGGMSVYGKSTPYVPMDHSTTPIIDLEDDFSPGNLVNRAFERHRLDPNDPVNQRLLEQYQERVNYVTHDPTRTAAEITSLLEHIRPDEDLPPEDREGTPDAMTYPLMEHQKLGLAWMKKMEESRHHQGAILADDMGLGKTVEMLALMVSRKSNDLDCKTNLVVAPVALLKQWEREIQSKLKPGREHALKTFILHGANRSAGWETLRHYDVVLTTFGTVANEVKRADSIAMKQRANPNWRPTAREDHLPLLGEQCLWYRVVIDEAQCIKNKNTKAAIGACCLKAKTRWCMTGTPMMNNVQELFSLIKFLRIEPYCQQENFTRDFTRPLKGSSETAKDRAMRKLQTLLKAILLRRTKKSQIDGKPILKLPERSTIRQQATFSTDEAEFYQVVIALESKTQLQFNKYLKAGTVGRNYSNILVLLLRLRQACCHPHLIKDFGQPSGAIDVTAEDMVKLAKELSPEVVARIKEACESNDDLALECPICMDLTENATIFIPCGHSTCSECFARISDPSQAIATGENADGRGEIHCPNCRGKITPSRVIDSEAFERVHMPGKDDGSSALDDSQADIETDDESDSEDDSDDELDEKGDLRNFIVDDDEDETKPPSRTLSTKSAIKKSRRSKGKGKAKQAPRKTLAQLKKEAAGNLKARRRYLRRLEKEWETSAKIEQTMTILRNIQDNVKHPEKTIIFSQFTSLLDLLEVPISRERWGYRRYDGSMSSTARNDAVLEFTDKKDCRIMLVSLKAGNAGLNLVAASQVIIFDPFWNPYIEEQAIDRAHRIGQLRPVEVHRILVPNTVEDRILALQDRKRELIEGALDEKASQSISRLGTRELAFLFNVPP